MRDLKLHGRGIKRRVVIALALTDGKRRRKRGLIKIFDLYVVSGFGQRLDSGSRQGMAQAIGDWMGDYNKTLHIENGLRDTVLMLANVK
ncbi:hypothetical protein MTYP_02757 [Methylophilaceae bacterium]|nr:hypothetical protein MTYP_02757 [Methylophilaceae bacterium]